MVTPWARPISRLPVPVAFIAGMFVPVNWPAAIALAALAVLIDYFAYFLLTKTIAPQGTGP